MFWRRKKTLLGHNLMMVLSNIFLILPVAYAVVLNEWIFLLVSSGLLIVSPIFHLFKDLKEDVWYFTFFRVLDWLLASTAFIYMYFYVAENVPDFKYVFYIFAGLLIYFFWYGYKVGNYRRLHPWFHVFAGVLAALVLLVAH